MLKGAPPLRDILPNGVPRRVGIAVSGGGDSMALLRVMQDIVAGKSIKLAVATVDHGLRPEAAQEAAVVSSQCAALGVEHSTLLWTDRPEAGNLQAEARRARYGLLAKWARESGLAVVLLGHTADDQAETVLMNLSRGSGVDGLCGMPAEFHRDGVRFLRPFLAVKRDDLRDYLRSIGQDWIDDPSNEDPRFARVRARQLLAELSQLGLTRERLLDMSERMKDAGEVLHANMALLAQSVELHVGDVLLPDDTFYSAPRDTRHRLLAAILKLLSGNDYRPRFRPLCDLAASGEGVLHGCLLRRQGGMLRVSREAAALENVTARPGETWDCRFRVSGPAVPGDEVRAMGKAALDPLPETRDLTIPRSSLMASPAIWRDGRMIAAPLAGIGEEWKAETAWNRTDFIESLLSR